MNYGQQSLASASRLELTVSLYDGIIGYLRQAICAVEQDDVIARRNAVKRALDIYMHLQSRLVYIDGSDVASTLDQFYTEMFRHTLLASASNSGSHFARVIASVEQVRHAWRTASRDPEALRVVQSRG